MVHSRQDRDLVDEYLDELELLADTAGAEILYRVIQERDAIDPAYFIGKGKVDFLAKLVTEQHADVVIFDEDLTPAQARNLEEEWTIPDDWLAPGYNWARRWMYY